MEPDLVTIVVPIYNVENYLRRCLDSIVAQQHRPLEVLLINDGSPDDSYRIINRYVEKYPDLFVPLKHENRGLGPTRNRGIALAKGEWICFVDSDDYLEPDYVSGMLKLAAKNNSDIVVSNFYLEMPSGKKYPFPLMTMYRNISGEKAAKEAMNLLTVPSFAWNKLIRTRIFRENEIEFPKLKYEDVAVAAKLLSTAAKVSITQKPYYHYCQRKTGIVGSFNESNIRDYLEVVSLVGNFLVEKKLNHKWRVSWNTFHRHVSAQVRFQIIVQMRKLKLRERIALAKEAKRELKKIHKRVISQKERENS